MKAAAKENTTPLYIQLKNRLIGKIQTGALRPGDKLPSESELQREYGLSRVTVRNAMTELEVGGFIVKVQGKGSFVAQPDMLQLPSGVMSFTGNAKMQGIRLTTEVLEAGIKPVNSELDKSFFGLEDGGEIMAVKRIRIADGIPISVEENHFSAKLETLAGDDLTGSLYELLMRKYRMIPSNKGRRSIYISYASEETAGYLDISVGTPVIDSELCVFDINGDPIHTVHEIVRGDNNKYMKWYV
jgi:GntR family transcriptional regulator